MAVAEIGKLLTQQLRVTLLYTVAVLFLLYGVLTVCTSGDRRPSSAPASQVSSKSASAPSISCPIYASPQRMPSETTRLRTKWEETRIFVADRRLTFINSAALEFHRRLITDVEEGGVPGMFLECGVAKAGSSLLFASQKNPDRCLHLFDTFEGIPKPSEKDGPDVHRRYKAIQRRKLSPGTAAAVDGNDTKLKTLEEAKNTYYGDMENLLEYDQKLFAEASSRELLSAERVFFHKGMFKDTVRPTGPVAYAHLDGDWFDSVYDPLKAIVPVLSVGAYIVLDDVFAYSGSKSAMADFFNLDMAALEELTRGKPSKFCRASVGSLHFRIALHERAYVQRISDAGMESSLYPVCISKA